MADRASALAKPIWVKQAEEAKLKSEAEKAAAAKAAFEATFKDVDKNKGNEVISSDSEAEEAEDLANKPIGPVDHAKCTAAGAGIAGGAACAPSTFVVVTKDSDGRKIPNGGAEIKVKVSPGVGVGGSEQEGIVKDQGDGTYTVTYVVPKRGNYMVNVECNGKPIMGSPFPVFFSAGTNSGGLLGLAPASTYPNLVNQTMPNMPNYSGSVSGAFPGLLGMIPGIVSGASGGAVLPGIGASLGEVCREYLNGRCAKTDCRFTHPPHNILMTALASTTTMGTLSQVPMAPSAAAMAAAQAIVAAQALQAHAAQAQGQAQPTKDSSGKGDALKRTLQVSNLSPLLTVDQLKQIFGFCGTILDCSITDSKHFAYIEYSKPEEATAALALNNMDLGGRPLNVEMAKSLPQKTPILNSPLGSSSLPVVMQQAVAMQQMQFQQALLMQQTLNAQQAANRAATMKSATELASARAAEISKKLKADGFGTEEKEADRKSRSPSASRAKSRSKSRSRSNSRSRSRSKSPVNYRRRRRSRSFSPRYSRDRRSPVRSRHYASYNYESRSSRHLRDFSERSRRRDLDRMDDRHSYLSRRHRNRSLSPRARKHYRSDSESPDRHRDTSVHRNRRSACGSSRSPKHDRDRSLSRNDYENKKRRRSSRSRSVEVKHHSSVKADEGREEKSKHRDRRRSRSLSVDVKHGQESLKESDERKSKHRSRRRSRSVSVEEKGRRQSRSPRVGYRKKSDRRGRSRSRSVEAKHPFSEKLDERRDEKSSNHHRRHSRSKHQSNVRLDESRAEKPKRRERRSRSTSSGSDYRSGSRSPHRSMDKKKQSRRRSSRSKSSESRHHSVDNVDETRDKKSKSRKRRSRSVSIDGKDCRGSRLSPIDSEEDESKQKRHSRLSSDDKHHSRYKLNENQDGKRKHGKGTRSGSRTAGLKKSDLNRSSSRGSEELRSKSRSPSRSKSSEAGGGSIMHHNGEPTNTAAVEGLGYGETSGSLTATNNRGSNSRVERRKNENDVEPDMSVVAEVEDQHYGTEEHKVVAEDRTSAETSASESG